MDVDVAIIGGGIVGLACAAAIARTGKSTVVLERHRTLGTETTSRSSEVIHAGLYYPPGSLKATTCVRGAALLYEWCASHGVPHVRCGKIIVATAQSEVGELAAIAVNAANNGALAELVSAERVRAIEPHVRCIGALFSPNTGVVDSHALVASLTADVKEHDGLIAVGRSVIAAERARDRWVLQCEGVAGRERVGASLVVNASGLFADDVAALFGIDPDERGLRQRFVKGSYFRSKRAWVKRLVYPRPSRDGLGIHATIDLAGDVRFGPDTALASSRTDYAVDESRVRAFGEAIRKYLPDLRDDDLVADTAGIRPKVHCGDFIVLAEDAAIHLVGIESPGLTAALAIAERVVMLVS